jgi:beta-galactosidase/evolved beta-galactosidase subunit alpha
MEEELHNRWDFLSLDVVELRWKVVFDEEPVAEGCMTLPQIPPHGRGVVVLDACPPIFEDNSDKWIDLDFYLRCDTAWLPAGSRISGSRIKLADWRPNVMPVQIATNRYVNMPRVRFIGPEVLIDGGFFSITLNIDKADIKSWRIHGRELVTGGPRLNFWRAPIDNDMHIVRKWKEKYLHVLQQRVDCFDIRMGCGWVEADFRIRIAPPALSWGIPVHISYRIYGDGTLVVAIDGTFEGDVPDELPKIGIQMKIPSCYQNVVWKGRGPGECYCDSCEANPEGIWRMKVQDMEVRYPVPQDNGNRTGVTWVVLQDGEGVGLAAAGSSLLDFSARKLEDSDLEKARHDSDLPEPGENVVLNLDLRNAGLGSASCGPGRLDAYKVIPKPFRWSIAFKPAMKGDNALIAGRCAEALVLKSKEE